MIMLFVTVPGAIDPPMATDISAYAALVTWEYPDRPNGVITSIKLYQNGALTVTVSISKKCQVTVICISQELQKSAFWAKQCPNMF